MELTTSWQKVAEASYQVTSNITGYLRLYMKYGNRDINNNRDTIYYEIRQLAYNPYGRYFAWQWDSALDWSIKNGNTVLANGNYTQSAIYSTSTDSTANEVVRASGSFVQNHNSDGSWSATLTLRGYIYTYAVSGSGAVSLPTIPRASTISVSNANIGSNTTITISRKSSSFTHTLTYSFSGLTGTIATKTSSTSVTWTIPTSFYAKIPNAKSGTATVTCTTYNGNTQVGSATTDTCTVTVNESTSQPVLTSGYSLTVSDSTSQTLTGASTKIINGYSTVTANLPVTVKNSATLSEYKVVNAGVTKTSQYSNAFTKVTSKTFDMYVKDSRGFMLNGSYPYTLSSLTLLDYFQPTIKTLNIRRTEQTSTSVLLSMTGTYWNKTFGSTTNVSSVRYSWRYKLSSSSSWGSWSGWATPTISGSNISITDLSLGSSFSTDQSYDFQLRIKDALGNSDSTMIVVSATQQVTKSIPIAEFADDYVMIAGTFYICVNGSYIPILEIVDE